VLALALVPAGAAAQAGPVPEAAPTSVEAGAASPALVGRADVREAFRAVVAPVRDSVAIIYCDERRTINGTVVGADGWVLTKASELDGELSCRSGDGTRRPARVVAVDEPSDLALLRVEADDLVPVRWTADAEPRLGQWVAAAAASRVPHGVGVLSVETRAIPTLPGFLGVMIEDAGPGAEITELVEGGAAQAGGLAVGDVVLGVDGETVRGRLGLIRRLRALRPGTPVELLFERDGERRRETVTLREWPDENVTEAEEQDRRSGPLSRVRSGFPAAFQHDTILRPSHCGGPVVDVEGRVIGLNIARAGRTGSYAIPAAEVVRVLERLRSEAGAGPEPATAAE